MKISTKLKKQIDEAIYNRVFEYLCQLDDLDRSNKISHEAWQLTHKPACELTSDIALIVVKVIEDYRK